MWLLFMYQPLTSKVILHVIFTTLQNVGFNLSSPNNLYYQYILLSQSSGLQIKYMQTIPLLIITILLWSINVFYPPSVLYTNTITYHPLGCWVSISLCYNPLPPICTIYIHVYIHTPLLTVLWDAGVVDLPLYLLTVRQQSILPLLGDPQKVLPILQQTQVLYQVIVQQVNRQWSFIRLQFNRSRRISLLSIEGQISFELQILKPQ